MTEHEEWLEQVSSILKKNIKDLREEWFNILHNVCLEEGETLNFPTFEDIFPSTPKDLWTGRMHDIYGQVRAYNTMLEFLVSHIQDKSDWLLLKPHLLGTNGNPSTE